jgi:hypothetical protein
MKIAGRNMAFLLKSLAEGKKRVPLPAEEPYEKTNFIHPRT